MPGPLAYAAAFLGSLALCWVFTPLMLRLAVRLSILDRPEARKSHSEPVPYLGGLAMLLAFALVLLLSAAAYRPTGGFTDLALAVGLAAALGVMGLVDDLRGLSPFLRLAVEIGAGLAVWGIGSGVSLPGPSWSDAVITVVWIVGVTNAFNLLDNMDGLSAGTAMIACASFFAIAVMNHQYLVAALSMAVAGCAAGFLRHNFHPAKIYMGDAGSLFLGFLLAFIGIRLKLTEAPQTVALFVPIIVLGVALFDTTLVTLNRIHHGRSILTGGKDHTSHRLVAIGLPVPVAVGVLYAAGVSLGWMGVILSRLDRTTGLLLIGFLLAAGMVAMIGMSAVPVYENSRQRQRMLRLVTEHEVAQEGTGSEPSATTG